MVALRVRLPPLAFRVVLLVVASVSVGASDVPRTREWSWRFVAGGVTIGSGAYDESGRYYFASDDRYLYALDRNGTMVWRTDLERRPGGNVSVAVDGTIYVTLENGSLLALNRDGRLVWRAPVDDSRPLAPVLLPNGHVVTVRRTGRVEARTHAGRFVWSVDVGESVTAAPVLTTEGHLVVATRGGTLVRLAVGGAELGRRFVGEVATVIGVGPGGVLVGSADGRVIAMNEALEPLWRADVGSAITELRVAGDGEIYVTSDDGSLSRVTPAGALAWKSRSGATMRYPIVGESVLITTTGVLASIGRDGTASWEMPLLAPPVGLTIAPYGAAVVTAQNWVTYAYEVSVTADGPWSQARGGPTRRGVAPDAARTRPHSNAFARSIDYLTLRGLLFAGGQSDQSVAMAQIAERVAAGANLAGSYHYLLYLSESVAGSPYFGSMTQFGPRSSTRRAREQAIGVLGTIGDLQTGDFLVRLLRYEPDPSLQALVLGSMAELRVPVDEALASRLLEIVRRDRVGGPSDALAAAVTRFVLAADEYRGGYIDPGVADVLMMIAESNYSRVVRTDALSVLRSLGGARP